jgi:dGTPase
MIRALAEQYKREETDLAAFAVRETGGRRHSEPEHPLRTDFQRDRDRILHSRAFRRLEYKTQVFLNGAGDHLRTRLTHTIEVAAICRTMARALYLNEDLAESIALAHDLGHTPFGHAGERGLNELMADHGGFDHNLQALRVVDHLEIKYPGFEGVNLTWEVRSGLIKHRDGQDNFLDGKKLEPHPSLESQIADLGDDLTYYGHDVDDGLDAGLINPDMLRDTEAWRLASGFPKAKAVSEGDPSFIPYTVRCLINMMVEDAVKTSAANIERINPASSADARRAPGKIISFSPDFQRITAELKDFLWHNVYFHPSVSRVNNDAVERMRRLFSVYVEKPHLMGAGALRRMESDGLHRTVADHIAGMTDKYAFDEHRRHCG